MGVRATSRASYRKLKNKLGEKQQELYNALREIEPASDRDLALKLDWSISHITPRRGELLKYGYIVNAGKKFDIETGRNVLAWATASPMATAAVDRAAGKERHEVKHEEPAKPEPAADPVPEPVQEATREVTLTEQAGEWSETSQTPGSLRRSQTQYRTQKIGVTTGYIYSDILTYFEDGYEENRKLV